MHAAFVYCIVVFAQFLTEGSNGEPRKAEYSGSPSQKFRFLKSTDNGKAYTFYLTTIIIYLSNYWSNAKHFFNQVKTSGR